MDPSDTPTPFQKTLLAFFVVFVAVIVFPDQNTIARFAWNATKNESLVAALGSYDGALYKAIGDYFLNGAAYDRAKALRAYEKARSFDPTLSGVNFEVARIHFLNGFFSQALMEARKERVIAPDDPRTDYLLGLIYGYRASLNDLKKAAEHFARFLEENPFEWAGYNDLAWVYLREKKFEAARATVVKAFETLPHTKTANPWLWTTYGVAELNLKEHTKAIEAFETALRIAREMPPKTFWSAYPGNNPRGAENAFAQFIGSLFLNLGIARERLGETREAIEAYTEYLTTMPGLSFRHKNDITRKIQTLRLTLQ